MCGKGQGSRRENATEREWGEEKLTVQPYTKRTKGRNT